MRSAPSLVVLRRRAPAIALLLLVLLCLAVVGIGCACMSDHPGPAIEQALVTITHSPAEPAIAATAWTAVLVTLGVSLVVRHAPRPRTRSPMELGRLLL